jgi:hypothetical protein
MKIRYLKKHNRLAPLLSLAGEGAGGMRVEDPSPRSGARGARNS